MVVVTAIVKLAILIVVGLLYSISFLVGVVVMLVVLVGLQWWWWW